MAKAPPPLSESLTFRLPETHKDALEKAAAADRRSVSALLVLIVEKWLIEQGYLRKRTK